jgi:hypothetical protein
VPVVSDESVDEDVVDDEEQPWLWAIGALFEAVEPNDLRIVMPQYNEFLRSSLPQPSQPKTGFTPEFSALEFAGHVESLLGDHPVLAMAPWGGRPGNHASTWSEISWLEHLSDWGSHPLGIIVPSAALTGKRVQALWAMLPGHIVPRAVITGRDWFPFERASLESAFLLLGPAEDRLLRMYRMPERVALDSWRSDFSRFLVQGGGRTEHGYILREGVPRNEPLNFGFNDPAALARAADLGAFGETETLGNLFEILRSVPRRPGQPAPVQSRPDGYFEVSARDIGVDGRVLPSPPQSERQTDLELAVGDLVLSEMVTRTAASGFRCGLVTEGDLPCVAGRNTLVLRPKRVLEVGVQDFVADYLRSAIARQVYEASARSSVHIAGHIRLTRGDLVNLAVPIPDPSLSTAVAELSLVSEILEGWHREAAGLLAGLFENPSAEAARRQILQSGRHLRARVESAARLDDFGQTVRTQFPYPIAHRWRSLEALLSGRERELAYRAALDTYEVFLCYSAQIAWTMARTASEPLGEAEKIRNKLAQGRNGLALGEWSAILDEVAGKRFAALPDDTPLGDVRRLVPPGSAAHQARIRLSDRRNDQAHLRPVPTHELETALSEVVSDLRLLLRQADFLVDMPLVHVASSRWDSIARRATLATRHLTGDHPVVPYRHETTERNDLEEGSLYVADPARGELHLLRPLLIGRECPECQTWSTFHIEQVRGSLVQLKSLEHGHTLAAEEMIGVLEAVGMLEA